LGKCAEFPAITAQGKTRDEVCGILHEMVKDYFELKKSKNL
jgi:predicted RNase H-like HicB family nuclease